MLLHCKSFRPAPSCSTQTSADGGSILFCIPPIFILKSKESRSYVMLLHCKSFRPAPSCSTQTSADGESNILYPADFHSEIGGIQNNPLTDVRGFALAGAIGIEPTQWESEAQVLPLHQAPSLKALYIIHMNFANTFCK